MNQFLASLRVFGLTLLGIGFALSASAQTEKIADTTKHRGYTAPAVEHEKTSQKVIPLVYVAGDEITPDDPPGPPQFKVYELKPGNEFGMAPGFYAEFKPKENDTIMMFDSSSEDFERYQIRPGKEVIQGDSTQVMLTISAITGQYDSQGKLITPPKRMGKTNSMVTRSGFIPAQGIGSKRWRFAVSPGNYKITPNSIISASVHIGQGENIGMIMCAVSKIDYEHNRFYVDTSNEVPLGQAINWIIVTVP
jgi:hypothetical protein